MFHPNRGALLASAVALVFAGTQTAQADLIPGERSNPTITVTAEPLDSSDTRPPRDPAVVYSNMETGPGGYVAFPAASGALGFDDYDSTLAGQGDLVLGPEFRFVGGVAEAGDAIFFDFFRDDETFVDGFGVTFDSAGNFIYTITVSDFTIPSTGLLQLTAPEDQGTGGASTGQWFLGDNGPTVGSQDPAIGSNADFAHNFELTADVIPEPGSLALLGLGGLALLRRRH